MITLFNFIYVEIIAILVFIGIIVLLVAFIKYLIRYAQKADAPAKNKE